MRTYFITFLLVWKVCYAQNGPITVEAHTGNYYRGITSSLMGRACSLACVMKWTLTASSTFVENGTTDFGIENLSDGFENTAWAADAKDYGIGEKLFARFICSTKTGNVSFWGLRLGNGLQKDSTTWKGYSRVKSLKVCHNSEPVLIINLQDKMGVETAKWDPDLIRLNNGDLISFEIMDVYKGDKFEATAISDLVLDGAH
jgi:hypothetical protein